MTGIGCGRYNGVEGNGGGGGGGDSEVAAAIDGIKVGVRALALSLEVRSKGVCGVCGVRGVSNTSEIERAVVSVVSEALV